MRRTLTPRSYVILGLLMDGAKHGYDLHRSELLRIWSIPMSQLYALLKRLEGRGLIHASRAAQENRPDRKVYEITEEGKRVFLDWIQRPSDKIRNIRTEFLAKLYIVRQLRLGIEKRLIKEQIRVCRELRKVFSEHPLGNDPFEHIVLAYRLSMIDATIRWLKQCKRIIG